MSHACISCSIKYLRFPFIYSFLNSNLIYIIWGLQYCRMHLKLSLEIKIKGFLRYFSSASKCLFLLISLKSGVVREFSDYYIHRFKQDQISFIQIWYKTYLAKLIIVKHVSISFYVDVFIAKLGNSNQKIFIFSSFWSARGNSVLLSNAPNYAWHERPLLHHWWQFIGLWTINSFSYNLQHIPLYREHIWNLQQ